MAATPEPHRAQPASGTFESASGHSTAELLTIWFTPQTLSNTGAAQHVNHCPVPTPLPSRSTLAPLRHTDGAKAPPRYGLGPWLAANVPPGLLNPHKAGTLRLGGERLSAKGFN